LSPKNQDLQVAKGLSPGIAPKDGLGVVVVTGHWRGIGGEGELVTGDVGYMTCK